MPAGELPPPPAPKKDRRRHFDLENESSTSSYFQTTYNSPMSPSRGYVHRNADTDEFGFPTAPGQLDLDEQVAREVYQRDLLRVSSSNQDLIGGEHQGSNLTRPRTRSSTRNQSKQVPNNVDGGQQRRKSRKERIQELLSSPTVRQQLSNDQQTYPPVFIYTITAIQVIMLIVSFIRNQQLTGTVIELQPFNIMIGPTSIALISLGARFVPCMKTNTLTPWKSIQCPITMDPSGVCLVADICNNDFNQWWRFIVPIFLHGGLLHLAFNAWFQWDFGGDLERRYGALRIAPIYFISGIFGFIFGANFAPELSPSVGASGALFGLVGCLFTDLIQHWKIVLRPWKEFFKIMLIVLISFLFGLLPGIDNFSHIGGFIAGVLSSFIFLPNVYFGKWDRTRKVLLMIGAVALLLFLYIGLVISFYNNEASKVCPWCKYLSSSPIGG